MRMLSLLLATLAITQVVAQDSFCVKYAKALFGKTDATLTGQDEANLIGAVVGRVVVGCDNNPAWQYGIPGVDATGTSPFRFYGRSNCTWPNPAYAQPKVAGLVNDTLNGPFFVGSAPNYNSQTGLQLLNDAAGIGLNFSIRFVNVSGTNVAANPATVGTTTTQGLIQHLVSFFGATNALGCKFYGQTGGIPTYAGKQDMKAVHAKMNITAAVWGEFVNTFANTLLSFGVAQSDIDAVVKPYIQSFLYGSTNPNQICNDPSCPCAPAVNGITYTKVNGTCTASGTVPPTTAAPTTPAPTGTPTTPAPAGNGTTSPPTKSAANMVSTSVATMVAAVAALLLAFL